jgi:hypothetical protein
MAGDDVVSGCWCYSCDAAAPGFLFRTRMNLCPDCGNKRCPRATWHGHRCTGSNAPGQRGSIYGPAPLTETWTGDPTVDGVTDVIAKAVLCALDDRGHAPRLSGDRWRIDMDLTADGGNDLTPVAAAVVAAIRGMDSQRLAELIEGAREVTVEYVEEWGIERDVTRVVGPWRPA